MFSPRRKAVTLVFLACLTAGIGGCFLAFQHANVFIAAASFLAISCAAFLLVPLLRNQAIEVCGKRIVVRAHGRAFELTAVHLKEVLWRKNGVISYRFQSGNSHFQVSPTAYKDADILQKEFDRLFPMEGFANASARR